MDCVHKSLPFSFVGTLESCKSEEKDVQQHALFFSFLTIIELISVGADPKQDFCLRISSNAAAEQCLREVKVAHIICEPIYMNVYK